MNRIEAARTIATERHVKRGFEIDPDSEICEVSAGIWVQAWVLVRAEDINKRVQEELAQ
jgi:hypothetical protein